MPLSKWAQMGGAAIAVLAMQIASHVYGPSTFGANVEGKEAASQGAADTDPSTSQDAPVVTPAAAMAPPPPPKPHDRAVRLTCQVYGQPQPVAMCFIGNSNPSNGLGVEGKLGIRDGQSTRMISAQQMPFEAPGDVKVIPIQSDDFVVAAIPNHGGLMNLKLELLEDGRVVYSRTGSGGAVVSVGSNTQ